MWNFSVEWIPVDEQRLTFLYAIEIGEEKKKKKKNFKQSRWWCLYAWALLWPPLTIYGQIEIYFYIIIKHDIISMAISFVFRWYSCVRDHLHILYIL